MNLKKKKHLISKQLRFRRRRLFKRLTRILFRIYKGFTLKSKKLKRFRTLPGFAKTTHLNSPSFFNYVLAPLYLTKYLFTKLSVNIFNKKTLSRSTKPARTLHLESKKHNYLPGGSLTRLGFISGKQPGSGITSLILVPRSRDLKKYSTCHLKRIIYLWRYVYTSNKLIRKSYNLISLTPQTRSKFFLTAAMSIITTLFR